MIRKFVRSSLKLNQTLLKNSFCVNQAYLNPERHITMNHNPNNMYEDTVDIGQYPLPERFNYKQQNRQAILQINQIVFGYLNKAFGTKLNTEQYNELIQRRWSDLGVSNIELHKQQILEELATNIFVKDHKYRWTIEQRNRLAETTYIYSKFNLNEFTVGFLPESYNSIIRFSVERSNLWQSPQIKGDSSFLEKNIQDHNDLARGVANLQRNIPENDNFINRFINRVHSN